MFVIMKEKGQKSATRAWLLVLLNKGRLIVYTHPFLFRKHTPLQGAAEERIVRKHTPLQGAAKKNVFPKHTPLQGAAKKSVFPKHTPLKEPPRVQPTALVGAMS